MLTVEVAPGLASWSYGDTTLHGGRHTLDPDAETAAAITAAVAANVLVLIDGDLDDSAVESDKESLRKLKVADAARAELYAERDEELRYVTSEAIAANAVADESDRLEPEALSEQVTQAAADKLAEWEQRMAEAAQTAVEGVI